MIEFWYILLFTSTFYCTNENKNDNLTEHSLYVFAFYLVELDLCGKIQNMCLFQRIEGWALNQKWKLNYAGHLFDNPMSSVGVYLREGLIWGVACSKITTSTNLHSHLPFPYFKAISCHIDTCQTSALHPKTPQRLVNYIDFKTN